MLGSVENCTFATVYGRPEPDRALKTKGVSTCTWTCPGLSAGNGDVVSSLTTATCSADLEVSSAGFTLGCASARITGAAAGQPQSAVSSVLPSSLPPRK